MSAQEPQDIPLDPEIQRLGGEFLKLAADFKGQGLPARTIRWALIAAAHRLSQDSSAAVPEHLYFLSNLSRYGHLSHEAELNSFEWSLNAELSPDHPLLLEQKAEDECLAAEDRSFFAWKEREIAERLAGAKAPTSEEPVAGSDNDRSAYRFDCPDGTWRARLDDKVFGKKAGNLKLYFTDIKTGERYMLSTFWNQSYRPREEGPDFHREASKGDCFVLTTAHTRAGTPKFLRAVLLNDGMVCRPSNE